MSHDSDSAESTPETSRRQQRVTLHPPSYSETMRASNSERPMQSPPPPFSANQNRLRNGLTDSDSLSSDISINHNTPTRCGDSGEATVDNGVDQCNPVVNENETESIGVTSGRQTADYAHPPAGDPTDFREYILPNSPPPAYESVTNNSN